MHYLAIKGGHAPGHLREAFQDYLEIDGDIELTDRVNVSSVSRRKSLRWLIGQLWNCTDILSSADCQRLDLQPGSTYAMAVRKLKSES